MISLLAIAIKLNVKNLFRDIPPKIFLAKRAVFADAGR
jgi:hypothetical protein